MGASAIALLVLTALVPSGDGRIVAEWRPGHYRRPNSAASSSSTATGSVVSAPTASPSTTARRRSPCASRPTSGTRRRADYVADPSVALPAELGYLAWAYLGGRHGDRRARRQRSTSWRGATPPPSAARGGAVWQGDDVEVARARRRPPARRRGGGGAAARRGDGAARTVDVRRRDDRPARRSSVRVVGPGGPIAGIPVTFEGDDGWSTSSPPATDGAASADGPCRRRPTVSAARRGPGDAVALARRWFAAPGDGRPAGHPGRVAGRCRPTTTTTTTTSTTVPPTTTTTTTTLPRNDHVDHAATTATTVTTTTHHHHAPRHDVPTTTTTTPPPPAASDVAADRVGQPRHRPRRRRAVRRRGAVLCRAVRSVRTRPAGAGRRRRSSP